MHCRNIKTNNTTHYIQHLLTESINAPCQQPHGHEPGDVGLHNQPVLGGGEEGRGRGEVVHVLPCVFLRPSGVEHQVARHPAHGEHNHDAPSLGERSLSVEG